MELFGADLGLEGAYGKAYYLIVIAGNIYLRFITTTPIGKRHAVNPPKPTKR